MRAERLLSILLLLQANRRMTSRQLAERLEVSPRTIHRDMDALSAAHVPIYAERGQGGGWVLDEDYRIELPGLTEPEIQALFLSSPRRVLADLQLQQASDSGLIKLLSALSPEARRDAEYVRQRIYIDLSGWRNSAEDVSLLPELQAAIWQDQKLRLDYRRADGMVRERLVDPLGLVAKGSVWYLVAAVQGDIRTFRVSRVLAAEMLAERSERPAGFDLEAYWSQSHVEFLSALPQYHATIRVRQTALADIRRTWRYAHLYEIGEPDAGDRIVVSVDFETEDEASRNVLSLGAAIEVMDPPELREKVIAMAKAIIAVYV